MSRELPRGQTVSDFLSSEVLAQRMQRLENVLGSLLAANGIGATWTDFTDTDCQALLEQAHDCLQEPSPNLAHWNQVLSKLGVDHIAQVGAWSARNPKIVEAILGRPPSSPGYVLLLEVAKRNEALGRQLPGVTVRGSRNHMLYSAVQRTLTHTHQLVRLQLSSDLLMGPDQGQYLPAPLTCTDQFILSHLLS